MYIVQDYSLAVIFCVVTMLCWGRYLVYRSIFQYDSV